MSRGGRVSDPRATAEKNQDTHFVWPPPTIPPPTRRYLPPQMCLGPLRRVFLALATSITRVHLGSRGEGSVPSAKLAICRRLEINDSPPQPPPSPPHHQPTSPKPGGSSSRSAASSIIRFRPSFLSFHIFSPPPTSFLFFLSCFSFLRDPCQSRRSAASKRRRLGVDLFRWSAVVPHPPQITPLHSGEAGRWSGAARAAVSPPTAAAANFAEFRGSR